MAELREIVLGLTDIEKKCLQALANESEIGAEELADKAHLNVDSVRRAMQWLHEKGLAELRETRKEGWSLSRKGAEALENGLPEKRLGEKCRALAGQGREITLAELGKELGQEMSIALGTAKKLNWLGMGKALTFNADVYAESERLLNAKQGLLRKVADQDAELRLSEDERALFEEFKHRGLVERKEHVSRRVQISPDGKQALRLPEFSAERKFVIDAPVPRIYPGKRQPYVQFIHQLKRKFVALGFKEVPSPLITQEFYNFDVLFQPQNHPARGWSDTYQLKRPTQGRLPDRKIVEAIRAAHENGGKARSSGWGCKWSEEIARKVMPASHCTAHDARQMVKGIEVPGKYFALNRVYRPDVLDAKHLVEFNQLDFFVVGKELNFRHVLGILEHVAVEIAGAKNVKFIPDYYPFTEPSVQLSCEHPKLGWMEFAGAGVFRPEMTENLGIQEPVIAAGMGVDRLAMLKMGVNDIRHLFSDDLKWLRDAPPVRE